MVARWALLLLVAGLGYTHIANATVKYSQGNGAWSQISWNPAGPPTATDTVMIITAVHSIPAGIFHCIVVEPSGYLAIDGGIPEIGELKNDGQINIAGMVYVTGNIVNNGTFSGNGILSIISSGARISGISPYNDVLINASPGSYIYAESDLVIGSLTLGVDNVLDIGPHTLTINGRYASQSQYGNDGIVSTAGTINLNGVVSGSVQGNVVLGGDPPLPRAHLRAMKPTVYGILGDVGATITFAGSRRVSLSTLIGDVTIQPDAIVQAQGIGPLGVNTIVGNLSIQGVLAGVEPDNRWKVKGNIVNEGTIEECMIEIEGVHATLNTVAGIWRETTSLCYTGSTNGILELEGAIAVPHLVIRPRSAGDTNIIIDADTSVIRIRHQYTSEVASHCRLVSDTIARVGGRSRGMIEGDVIFEGFWGSEISGAYGAPGDTVRMNAGKRVTGDFDIAGEFIQSPAFTLRLSDTTSIQGNANFGGRVELDTGMALILQGDFIVGRTFTGSGKVLLVDSGAILRTDGDIEPGIQIEIGTDSTQVLVEGLGIVRLPDVLVRPGSGITYSDGDSLAISGAYSHTVTYLSGNLLVAAACYPDDIQPPNLFTGTNGDIYEYHGSYTVADSLIVGEGYLTNYLTAPTITHTGKPVNLPLSIPVIAGWNLIGGGAIPVDTANITVSGTSLLSGFMANANFTGPVTTLQPGHGYWVRFTTAGSITLRAKP